MVEDTTRLDRRGLLKAAAAAGLSLPAFASLAGCDPPAPTITVGSFGPGPSVLSPRWAGFQALPGTPDLPANVFFPSSRENSTAVLAEHGPYPLVVFLHGNCETPQGHETGSYRGWTDLPGELARSGYVVLVPRLPGIESAMCPCDDPNHPDLARVDAAIAWLRGSWEHRAVLAPETIVGGHSYGALLAGRLAELGPGRFAAFLSLSGEWNDYPGPARRLTMPLLFMKGDDTLDPFADLRGIWPVLHAPKHMATLRNAGHWDYLPAASSGCSGHDRGSCDLSPRLAADLATMFVSKYVPPARSGLGGAIPDDLAMPIAVPACNDASCRDHGPVLTGLAALSSSSTCGVDLEWATARGSGNSSRPQRR